MSRTERLLSGILVVLILLIVLDVVFFVGVKGAIVKSFPFQKPPQAMASAGQDEKQRPADNEGMFECDSLPKFLHLSQPKYPDEMRKNGIEGANIVRLLVDEKGQVKEVSILQSAGLRAFDEAAMIAAVQSTFVPGKLKGKPAPCYVSVPFKFALQDKKP